LSLRGAPRSLLGFFQLTTDGIEQIRSGRKLAARLLGHVMTPE
jgi:hypothetical protein